VLCSADRDSRVHADRHGAPIGRSPGVGAGPLVHPLHFLCSRELASFAGEMPACECNAARSGSLSLSLSLSVSLARARSGGSRLARRDSPSRFPIDFFRHAAHKVIFVTIIVERLRHQGQRLIILQLTNVSLTYDTASVERDFSRFFVLPTTVRHRKSCVACGYRFESPRLLIKIPLETRELVQRSLVRRPVSKRVRNAVRLGHKFNDRDKFAIGVT